MEANQGGDTIGTYSFMQSRREVQLLGGPCDGLRANVQHSSAYIKARLPREPSQSNPGNAYLATYVRSGPASFQHESTVIVTGD